MTNQTKSAFREMAREWGGLGEINLTMSQKRYSPTLAIAIQDIFLEEDVNAEMNAVRLEIELEAIQLLPHRLLPH